jgi:nucleotide-binding universal stress UspA family protein
MTTSFRRILVGWDGSADAAEALRAAAAIVGHQGGHVVALAVVRPQVPQESTEDQLNESHAIRRQAEEQFSTLRRQSGPVSGLRLTVHVLTEGNAGPGQAICDYAATHGFDLLVVGRHGGGGARRDRLGRVASAAAQASPVPLLLLSAR